jgi:hypothetical protein
MDMNIDIDMDMDIDMDTGMGMRQSIILLNVRMPDFPVFGQSGTVMKNKRFSVRYQTETMDAGKPMPSLVF